MVSTVRVGGGQLVVPFEEHFLRVRCVEGAGWVLLAGLREAESARFHGEELHLRLRWEWSASEVAGWPLIAVELWRAGPRPACKAVGAFPLPMLAGAWETELPLVAGEGAEPQLDPLQLLLAGGGAGTQVRTAGWLALTGENCLQGFALNGAELTRYK